MLDRLAVIKRSFEKVLLLGCPTRALADATRRTFPTVDLIEPAEVMARTLGASTGKDVKLDVEPGRYDLIISLGTLGDADDPAEHLMRQRFALAPGGLALGALIGGASLPALRSAMRAADEVQGLTRPHIHPRIDPASLTQLLSQAGFEEPVVDVDRVNVRYPSLSKLVDDLRKMGTGNFLAQRNSSPLDRMAYSAAADAFAAEADEDGKTSETFEIVHFMGWQASPQGS